MKWQCAWCGREYDSEDPPCGTCGHEVFEPVSAGSASPFESGSLVWVCTNCGREHVKHSPPCSRCGNHVLEKREAGSADLSEDVSIPGYLSVGKPYLFGIVAVLVLVGLVLAGVVPLPGLTGPPAPPDAPGDADTSAGLDLAVVEAELHGSLDAERAAAGSAQRARGDGLDAFAEYATRHRVADRYDPEYDGTVPDFGAFDPQCGTSPTFGIAEPDVDITAYDGESAVAEALADRLLSNGDVREAALDDRRAEGIDVHVGPDGTVFVGYLAC
ncbi:hypothetical protein [Natronomonas sp. LN261]|uniref:hypothetical protein n=1 Tax=Natronomonas sp. LN261 TaxID=2750669 RepID=UPI0015EF4A30|nr:hypothetical protein [Natronomonas sp. LN261]